MIFESLSEKHLFGRLRSPSGKDWSATCQCPADSAMAREANHLLWAALEQLSDTERRAVCSNFVLALGPSCDSFAPGPPSTIRSRCSRALIRLRYMLQELN